MQPQALIIYTSDQHKLAEALVAHLAEWQAATMVLDNPPPDKAPALLLPLLSDPLIEEWERSPLGEWAMECLEDDRVRLVPVIAEECEWQDSLFFGLPLLPHARVPIHNPGYWKLEEALEQLVADLDNELTPPSPAKPGGFKRAALRLLWRSMPARWKWIGGIGLTALLTLIVWLILG